MNTENNKLWTGSYILNDISCFIINVPFYMLMVIMTDFAVGKLGATLSEAGFATGSFVIGALLARVMMGGQIERIGLKSSLYIGLSVFLLGLALNFLVHNILWLSIIRIMQGVGFGISSTTTGAIMAHMVPETRRGEGTSFFAMFVTLATAVGPSAGTYLYNGSLNLNLAVSMILILLCMVCVRNISVPNTYKTNAIKGKKSEKSVLSRFIEPHALPIAFITFLVNLGFASILSFISSFEIETGLTETGEYFFIVYAFFTLLSRPFTGRLFDKFGASIVMYPSFAIFGIGLLLLGITSNGWCLLLVAVCMGIGFGTYMSCAQAIAIMVAPRDKMSVATSTFFIFMDLAVGAGPALMGMVIPFTGFRGLYFILGIIQFVCAFLYYLTTGRKIKKTTPVAAPYELTSQEAPSGLVITISREYGSGGKEIGQRIAARLGIPCYDREIIERIVAECNMTDSIVSTEEQRVNPSELYRMYAWYAYSFPMGQKSVHEQLFNMDCQIITNLASKGACVIIGRLAHRILKDYPNTVNIYIHASENSEAFRVSKRENINIEEARNKVKRVNKERAAHCEYFTHTIWSDAANYDLTINTDLYGIDETSELLSKILQHSLPISKLKNQKIIL